MNRIFIVGPASEFDIVYHVCSTPSEKSLGDVYDDDDYVILNSFVSLEESNKFAGKFGAGVPEVI